MDGYSEDLETTSLLRHNRKTSTAVPKLYSETKHGIETARMEKKEHVQGELPTSHLRQSILVAAAQLLFYDDLWYTLTSTKRCSIGFIFIWRMLISLGSKRFIGSAMGYVDK